MRIGLLGAARITPAAIIQPARNVEGVVVQAVAARDPHRARKFARDHGVAAALAGYEELVTSADIDLVYNALPVSHHAQWSIRALEAGKHVLCEKPLAMHAGEARDMVAAARHNGVRLVEAFHYRYHPMFITFLNWLARGRIGAVQKINAHFNTAIPDDRNEIRRRVDTGGGAMMDLGCYPLNWVLQVVAGTATAIEAVATLDRNGVDEKMAATLSFDGGVTATISTSMAAGEPFTDALDVTGEAGTIRFKSPLAPHSRGKLVLTCDGRTDTAAGDNRPTYFHQLLAVASAIGTGKALPMEGEAILRQQEMLDAVYAAAGLGHLRRTQQE